MGFKNKVKKEKHELEREEGEEKGKEDKLQFLRDKSGKKGVVEDRVKKRMYNSLHRFQHLSGTGFMNH